MYFFFVGVSTCYRKTNDQDNDGNMKNKTNIFQNNVLLFFFQLKHSIKNTYPNLLNFFRDDITDST